MTGFTETVGLNRQLRACLPSINQTEIRNNCRVVLIQNNHDGLGSRGNTRKQGITHKKERRHHSKTCGPIACGQDSQLEAAEQSSPAAENGLRPARTIDFVRHTNVFRRLSEAIGYGLRRMTWIRAEKYQRVATWSISAKFCGQDLKWTKKSSVAASPGKGALNSPGTRATETYTWYTQHSFDAD
ncbi:hypothetical protein PV05_06540 [Exophiala xenobiotica]|uniref:Uncharacterized protein n=1 Tax=Exophiala xenobiotica TaxID=348802 RepID=A0A0D2EHQ3_9EURO|nr:uncharacterized protein PV05_06540 [Exophiala xenobiotica]KIW54160.1 hypothetical protein PV05_06540 [Exophiala xenobiotica]